MSRRRARELAFQGLYAWDLTGGTSYNVDSFPWRDVVLDENALSIREPSEETSGATVELDGETEVFARMLYHGAIERMTNVDSAIRVRLRRWTPDRLARVDLAILRLGVYQLIYQPTIPRGVVINESVELAKQYGGPDSSRFVNGLLDSIRPQSPNPKSAAEHGTPA